LDLALASLNNLPLSEFEMAEIIDCSVKIVQEVLDGELATHRTDELRVLSTTTFALLVEAVAKVILKNVREEIVHELVDLRREIRQDGRKISYEMIEHTLHRDMRIVHVKDSAPRDRGWGAVGQAV